MVCMLTSRQAEAGLDASVRIRLDGLHALLYQH